MFPFNVLYTIIYEHVSVHASTGAKCVLVCGHALLSDLPHLFVVACNITGKTLVSVIQYCQAVYLTRGP